MEVFLDDFLVVVVVLYVKVDYQIFFFVMYGSELEMWVYECIKIFKEFVFDEVDLKVYCYSYKEWLDYLVFLKGCIIFLNG